MRALILSSLLALTTPAAAIATTAQISPTTKKLANTTAQNSNDRVGTDFHFNDQTVHGHYQSPNEGIVTVEDEKSLGDLLDYRTEYKSRLKESFSIR